MSVILWGGSQNPATNDSIARFVAARIPNCHRGWDRFVTMGVVIDPYGLVAGVVFHNYNPEAGVIELSAASTNRHWLDRHSLKAMFSYVFDEIGCQMAIMRVSGRNNRMNSIARRFGFSRYSVPRLRGREEDENIWTLTEEQWRAHPINRKRAKVQAEIRKGA